MGWIQPQLSGFPCWAQHPPWICDGLDNWSHYRRICIDSAWVSDYALESIWTHYASIGSAPALFWKKQLHRPSRSGNTSSSIHLGNSALTSKRLQEHYTTWRACFGTQKILGFPLWRWYTASMLCPWWSVKNLLSGPDKRNTQLLQDSTGLSVCGVMDKNLFWSLHSTCRSLCRNADLCPFWSAWQCYTMGFG